jgi:type I restriction enzyme, S subunit
MLENFLITVPKIEIQQKIANFLDEKSKIFDESISKKEQLISKLELAKQSLISEVVTGKLKIIENNSKLQTIKREQKELKPSGVEWLGDIPKDWEVKKLKYLVEVPLKYGANESAELIDKNLPRYIRITDFANDGLLKEDTFRSLSEDKAKDFILKDGDVLFARSGGTVGKTFQFKNYNGIACFAGYLISARPNKKIVTSDFIYLFTRTLNYQNWKNSIFMQATIQNIGADKYNELYFPYTKLEEQKQISKYLDEKLIHFDNTIEKTKQSIKKLKLAKEALISQAVTGKIEVL